MENNVFYRMITREYWPAEENIDDIEKIYNDIGIKTIYRDFRNKDNTLSIWNLNDYSDAALALVNPNFRLDTLCFVKLKKEELLKEELNLENNKGLSLIDEYNGKHYDIRDVNYKSLGKIIKLILKSIKNEDYKIVTPQEIVKLIENAVVDNKIDSSKVPKDIMEKIKIECKTS